MSHTSNPTAAEVVQAWHDYLRDSYRPLIVYVGLLVSSFLVLYSYDRFKAHMWTILFIQFAVIVVNNLYFKREARRALDRFNALKAAFDARHPTQAEE